MAASPDCLFLQQTHHRTAFIQKIQHFSFILVPLSNLKDKQSKMRLFHQNHPCNVAAIISNCVKRKLSNFEIAITKKLL